VDLAIYSAILVNDKMSAPVSVKNFAKQKQAPDPLHETRAYLQAIFLNSLDAILVTNDHGRFIDANPAACGLLGYTHPELMKLSVIDLASDEFREDGWARWQRFLEAGRGSGEFSARHRDRSLLNLEFRSVANITPGVHVSFIHDVTDRKRAEKAQRAAEEKYESIFENALEGIFQTTREGQFVVANPALARMFGFDSPEELIRERADLSGQHYVNPRRREDFKRLMDANDVIHEFEYETYRKDGSTIWVSDNVRAVRDADGNLVCYEGIAKDITKRKCAETALRESEERYRDLFENAKDAYYVHDLQGRYTSVNKASEKLCGYSREEIIGRSFADFLAPEHLDEVSKHLCRKLVEEGETTYETELITCDGRRVPIEVSSHLLYDELKVVAVQGTVRDITESKRAESTLRNYSRMLVEAQEAERKHIARELHDQIGQMLTAIKFNLQTLGSSKQIDEGSAEIDQGVDLIDTALEQVRNLSFELRPLLLDNMGLVTALRWYSDQFAHRTGISTKWQSNLPEGKLSFGQDLETACFRIVQEALTNVVRHAQARKLVIKLNAADQETVLSIRDDGVGFDLRATQDNKHNIHLGLIGMRERALALGGTFEIISAPAEGTEVRVVFPTEAQPDEGPSSNSNTNC